VLAHVQAGQCGPESPSGAYCVCDAVGEPNKVDRVRRLSPFWLQCEHETECRVARVGVVVVLRDEPQRVVRRLCFAHDYFCECFVGMERAGGAVGRAEGARCGSGSSFLHVRDKDGSSRRAMTVRDCIKVCLARVIAMKYRTTHAGTVLCTDS